MALAYSVSPPTIKPFRVIKSVSYAIWSYHLSWRDPMAATIPVDPGPRLALVFPSRLDIRDPQNFPDVAAIQDTGLQRLSGGDIQYVYQDIQAQQDNSLTLSFVAPLAADTFTPVRVARQSLPGAAWTVLPFDLAQQGDAGLQQIVTGPAFVCPTVQKRQVLTQSARTIEKATINSLLASSEALASAPATGNAIAKFNFAQQLLLQRGDVQAIQSRLASQASGINADGPIWSTLSLFETSGGQAQTLPLDVLADIPVGQLHEVGNALAELRQAAAGKASHNNVRLPFADFAKSVKLARAATVATKGLALNSFARGVRPIGYMNLERLEMVPAGIVRGELIATIPLAPLEETAVVQKEWSVTSKEFTSIVTDSLENYSETGVTDNTELAQSTTSQNQHSNQFNITGTVSGGISHIFDAQASSGFTAQDSSSQSATASTKHSATLTQKASSRVKKEHKVTISTTTVTGSSESTTRTLKNPDPINPIRVDYFRMMREWRVRLYRYGIRMTYDLMIPEPGAMLRQAHAYLEWLKSQVGPFKFNVPYSEITDAVWSGENEPHYQVLAERYGAQVPPPPVSSPPFSWIGRSIALNIDPLSDGSWRFYDIEFDVPPNCEISDVFYDGYVGAIGVQGRNLTIVGFGEIPIPSSTTGNDPLDLGSFLVGAQGHQTITFRIIHIDIIDVKLKVSFKPTAQAHSQWVSDVWNALYNAAQAQYYTNQQDVAAKIETLEGYLTNIDTLTLRREESEEVMKMAIAMLAGRFTSDYWQYMQIFEASASPSPWPPIVNPANPLGGKLDLNQIKVSPGSLGSAFARVYDQQVYPLLPWIQDDELVARFINQAIEWENVVTFLYSYFWDTPDSWDFIRNIKHQDPTRQAFLRAGSARVVLTIRRGWEEMWAAFVQTGQPYYTDKRDPNGNPIPYLTIAQEIAAYDDRNYPGIPPANPGESATRLEDSVYTTSVTYLDPPQPTPSVPNPPPLENVEIEVVSSAGFVVGAQVLIDSGVAESYPNGNFGRQEATTIKAIGDSTHLTLAQIRYPHGGDNTLYAVIQPSEKGALISEWNEYTPTSGTDIAVTSNLETIA